MHQLQLVSPSLCSITFLGLCQSPRLRFRFLYFSLCGLPRQQNLLDGKFFFIFFLITWSGLFFLWCPLSIFLSSCKFLLFPQIFWCFCDFVIFFQPHDISLLLLLLLSFSHQRCLIIFHWSLSDRTSPQYARTLLSILVDLNNAADCMVSTRTSISKLSSPFYEAIGNFPNALFIIDTTVTSMFRKFSISLAMFWYLLFFVCFLLFLLGICQGGKIYYPAGSIFFFFFCWLSLGMVVWPILKDPFAS